MSHWLRENHEAYMPHNAANVLKPAKFCFLKLFVEYLNLLIEKINKKHFIHVEFLYRILIFHQKRQNKNVEEN